MKRQEFLKGEIHYNVKVEDRKTTYKEKQKLKTLIVRIDKEYEFNYQNTDGY
jgi:hypothetical protein